MKQETCSYCREKAEYRVEISEWDEKDKDYTKHPDTQYLCLLHMDELGGQLP